MTPDERLELLLGQAADHRASGAPASDVRHLGGYPTAALGELAAIANALERLELPLPPARSAALRAQLEAEATRLGLPPAVGSGPPPGNWLPWVGGILLLTAGLWLALQPWATGRRGDPQQAGTPARTDGASEGIGTETTGRATVRGDQGADGRPTPAVVAATLTAVHYQDDVPPLADGIATAVLAPSPPSATGVLAAPISTIGSGESRGSGSVDAGTAMPSGERAAAGLRPPGVSDGYLRGQVTDSDGRGIAAAEITAYRQDRPGIFVQRTDVDGRYAILLPWGRYRLEARATGFASMWYRQVAAAEAAAILHWEMDTPDPAVDFALPSAPSPVTNGG